MRHANRPTAIAMAVLWLAGWSIVVRADVALNNMFGDHMVLQRGIRNRVWGKADPGEAVTVTFGTQSHAATAAADGTWQVLLDAVEEYGGPHTLAVKGKNTVAFDDVLIGEVWLCAGQSNMQWTIDQSKDADLEKAAARFPNIRLLTVPNRAAREPQWNFEGQWQVCSPETVGGFSAVGYLFGRQIHETIGVPVGLIAIAWGGSAAEAWMHQETIAANEKLVPLIDRWTSLERNLAAAKEEHSRTMAEWNGAAAKARADGQPVPSQPIDPVAALNGNQRPGNIHSGMLAPSIGYGMRGVIWYQGESNSGRAYQYRELFPLLIRSWRDEWGLGDFPFYWAQLADYDREKPASSWAELREAQTMTMDAVPNVGQAVIIDLGEGNDIHPRNKQDVARRLARWALAETYKLPGIPCRSPVYRSLERQGDRIVLAFDHVTGGWRPFDVDALRGFTVAGPDRNFVAARAAILADGRIEVSSERVPDPVAVRYAWSDDPVCNLYSGAGLPLTPFRTDDFPGVTAGAH